MIIKKEIEWGGRTLTIETGRVAKQAQGAVTVKYGDSMILATVCAAEEANEDQDFFPLTVDYREKSYAAGKIPGGFFKREGKPGDEEVLISRLIDRPIRPLFPDGFFNEVQVIISAISADEINPPDVLGIIGAGAALHISPIPFEKPVAGMRVGLIKGEYIANPTHSQMEESELEIIVAGTEDSIAMVEGGADFVSEEVLLGAVKFAYDQIQPLIKLIKELRDELGNEKWEVVPPKENEEIREAVLNIVSPVIREINSIQGKKDRGKKLKELKDKVLTDLEEKFPEEEKLIKKYFEEIEKKDVREKIITEEKRIDGRGYAEVRDISCELGFLPRAHGSAIFTRGQTQALASLTLGTVSDEQIVDDLAGDRRKKFMLHYNFPPFSVGEVRFLRGPGRREIGHGHLAERSLSPIIPSDEEFPYTVRIVSEVLESNGSSSMASICGGSLALMDAGVPISSPVAGIAMGLIHDERKTAILTDILGEEDHLGDMDFKVAGNDEGISGFQLDLKISGISFEIMEKALKQAKEARLHILKIMNDAISKPREEVSPYAPKIAKITIDPDVIKDVIGSGGKVIKGIIEKTGTEINIDNDGIVTISAPTKEKLEEAKDIIKRITDKLELNETYTGIVTRIANFGAFVELAPNKTGLVHISELADRRVGKVEDVVNIGDEVKVKVIGFEHGGKIKLSIRKVKKDN